MFCFGPGLNSTFNNMHIYHCVNHIRVQSDYIRLFSSSSFFNPLVENFFPTGFSYLFLFILSEANSNNSFTKEKTQKSNA